MQRSFAIIVTSAVLVHATFGCCLHHSHSDEVDRCESSAAYDDACPCDGHAAHSDSDATAELERSDENGREHSHGGPHRCDGRKCSFARTESAPDTDSRIGEEFVAVLALPAVFVGQITAAQVAATSFKTVAVSCTPRLHLVLAVLLI